MPKKAKKRQKRQILQTYNTARFVQYGKIRIKYDMAYYTNTPYDTSLHNAITRHMCYYKAHSLMAVSRPTF